MMNGDKWEYKMLMARTQLTPAMSVAPERTGSTPTRLLAESRRETVIPSKEIVQVSGHVLSTNSYWFSCQVTRQTRSKQMAFSTDC